MYLIYYLNAPTHLISTCNQNIAIISYHIVYLSYFSLSVKFKYMFESLGGILELKYVANEKDNERTVKSILKNELGISLSMLKRLKHESGPDSGIYVNSQPVYVNYKVKPGDVVLVRMNFDDNCDDIVPENIKIDILYEDEYLIVINKAANMVVHPVAMHQSGTLANAITYHLAQKGINIKVRPVTRLDKDTSGVIVFAKNPYIQNALSVQMSNKSFLKEYIGIVWGTINEDRGTINLPIERKPNSIMLRHISETGKPSITNYEVIKRYEYATLLKFSLETGRTHQIRVHCQAINHPIMGDTLYWKWVYAIDLFIQKYSLCFPDEIERYKITEKQCYENQSLENQCSDEYLFNIYKHVNSMLIQRQALHSYKVRFLHPIKKSELEIIAPLHDDMKKALEILENK